VAWKLSSRKGKGTEAVFLILERLVAGRSILEICVDIGTEHIPAPFVEVRLGKRTQIDLNSQGSAVAYSIVDS
jgi:hypothetical protein